MSYPEPRYLGGGGETSATARPADAAPDLVLSSTNVHYLATGSTTGGDFGLYRWEMTGPPSGPAPHFHRTISESFYVLEGTVRLYDGRAWTEATAGDFLFVPAGGIHAFRNESGAPASMLLLFTPGAPRERYFEGLAEIAASGRQLSPEEMTEFLREHDQYAV
jgi:mannose-6-phosphate isomerase-like protein (cupin superfamily)